MPILAARLVKKYPQNSNRHSHHPYPAFYHNVASHHKTTMIPSRIPHALRPLRLVSRSTLRSASSSATNTAALKPKAQPRRAAFSSSTPLRQKVVGEDRLPPSQLPGRKGTRDQQPAIPPAAEAADSAPAVFVPVPEPTSSAPLPSAPEIGNNGNGIDWSQSFHGLSTTPFSPETAVILMSPIDMQDVEVKPDGIIYLPEIKYRRILNQAFGPGGWGLAPRGEVTVSEKVVSREYALIVHGRYAVFPCSPMPRGLPT